MTTEQQTIWNNIKTNLLNAKSNITSSWLAISDKNVDISAYTLNLANLPSAISSIQTGILPNNGTIVDTISENGSKVYTPGDGETGLSKVELTISVPTYLSELNTLLGKVDALSTLQATENKTYTPSSDSLGWNSVEVNVPVLNVLNKSVELENIINYVLHPNDFSNPFEQQSGVDGFKNITITNNNGVMDVSNTNYTKS